jgi:hypothetical protein
MNEIIKNFTELNRLINNTILLMNRYSIECNKLNKQTDHIKNQIGKNYLNYTDEQKSLIQKHTNFMIGLLNLINTPIMNEDGSFNGEMVAILRGADHFLKDSSEIKFISYKKRKPILGYIVLALVAGMALYFYYKKYFL